MTHNAAVATADFAGRKMIDQSKSQDELIEELVALREEITILKLSEIQRKRAEDALRLSEELNKAILSSLNEQIAVLDKQGNIISVNEAWERHADESDSPLQTGLGIGSNYFEACRAATGDSSVLARAVLGAIEIVNSGAKPNFTLEYEENSSSDRRWFWVNITRLANAQGGLVIAHIDITERKLAEEERERMIQQLQEAAVKIKTLRGLLPICAACKKIRDDGGYWKQIEVYIKDHSEADFSHSICPDCAHRLYPDIYVKKTKTPPKK